MIAKLFRQSMRIKSSRSSCRPIDNIFCKAILSQNCQFDKIFKRFAHIDNVYYSSAPDVCLKTLNKKTAVLRSCFFFVRYIHFCCVILCVTEQQQNKRTFKMNRSGFAEFFFFLIRCHNCNVLIKYYLAQNFFILCTVSSRHFKIFWHITGMHGFMTHTSAQNILHHTMSLQPIDNTTLSIFGDRKHFVYYSSLSLSHAYVFSIYCSIL